MVMILDTPSVARVAGSAPSNDVGKPRLPTPTMVPWPGMSRGTDCTVPMVPGLVRLTVTPAKSSAVSLLVRTLRIRSS